jgi:tetratricopeptide (TPR) repeat protein
MRRWRAFALWAMVAAGCVSADSQRVREFTEDGVLLYQSGKYAEARDTFQAARAMKPNDPNLVFNLAQCSDRLGDYGKAEQQYRECVQLAPNHGEAMHALTVLLVNERRRDEAGQLVEDWVRRDPQSAAAYAEYSWLCRHDRDMPAALAAGQRAYELDPTNLRGLTELGQVFEEYRHPDRALDMYERSLQLQPDQPDLVRRVSMLKEQGAGRPHPE